MRDGGKRNINILWSYYSEKTNESDQRKNKFEPISKKVNEDDKK